ncbi:hypothetical protein L7F22_060064 [Adiantum nelumboides]|nr:hypothetical protein [Adiantum nelumboides]
MNSPVLKQGCRLLLLELPEEPGYRRVVIKRTCKVLLLHFDCVCKRVFASATHSSQAPAFEARWLWRNSALARTGQIASFSFSSSLLKQVGYGNLGYAEHFKSSFPNTSACSTLLALNLDSKYQHSYVVPQTVVAVKHSQFFPKDVMLKNCLLLSSSLLKLQKLFIS